MHRVVVNHRAIVGCLAAALAWCSTSATAEEPSDDVVGLVVNLLGDADKDVRALGLEQVRSAAKGPEATRQFAAQLPKLSAEAQVGLLAALADRKDAAARPAVLELLSASSEEPVRVAAIAALGSLGEPGDVSLLVRLLAEGSAAERKAARASLAALPGEAVPAALVTEVGKAAVPAKVAIIEILAIRRAKPIAADLVPLAADAEPAVRSAAMKALGQLAGSQQIPGMIQGVFKAAKGRERDAAERALAEVCTRSSPSGNRAIPLLAAMGKLPAADQNVLLPALGRLGGRSARTKIERSIADADSARHEAGLRGLCNWPDSSIAERLIELATSDEHAEHRTVALAALIRVAPLPDERPVGEKLELLKTAMSLCARDEERQSVIKRLRAIRTVDSLRFLAPYLDQPSFSQGAAESVVELAHHRELREANKAEFHRALDKVIATSQDAIVVERANRYKRNQTWARPKPVEAP